MLMAYGLTCLMGILMWYGSTKGYDLTVFPTAQMMYPAAGVIIGLFLVHKGEKILPAGFFITVLATTGILRQVKGAHTDNENRGMEYLKW